MAWLSFAALMLLVAIALGAWWALVDAVASVNWYHRGTTPSDEPQQRYERQRLMQLAATYQPPSVVLFSQPAKKGFSRKQGVSAGTKTPPVTPAA